MVAELTNQDMGEQARTRHTAINGTAGCSRLHDAVAASAGFLRPTMTNHSPMTGHVLELLGDVLAKIAECSTALRAARIIGLMDDIFARQMLRERFASSRLARVIGALLARLESRRAFVGLQILKAQFQLLDLAIDLLGLAPELHSLELGDPQLQALDFQRSVRESLLKRRDGVAQIFQVAVTLAQRRFAREQERLQGVDVVRKRSVAGVHAGSLRARISPHVRCHRRLQSTARTGGIDGLPPIESLQQ
ncbi:hypothetical protein FQZ97_848530 [compost metagenome]